MPVRAQSGSVRASASTASISVQASKSYDSLAAVGLPIKDSEVPIQIFLFLLAQDWTNRAFDRLFVGDGRGRPVKFG